MKAHARRFEFASMVLMIIVGLVAFNVFSRMPSPPAAAEGDA